ncbi:MAG: cation-transporting P-type ATPase [Patescibacteria group bacterium]|nr:cation-transporting P-type ATPase [Patescibacteria group bacterium]
MKKNNWHSLPLTEVYKLLNSGINGISFQDASERQKKMGLNELPTDSKLNGFKILFSQLSSPLVYILIAAAIISAFLQDGVDTVVILIAVLINTVVGFYQEYKANKAMSYLKKLIDLKAKVLREGNEIKIKSNQLVPGDIIYLDPGDKIQADCRLISIDNLQINEAALTGESLPSTKSVKNIDIGTALADRKNMVYSGTIVSSGKGMAIVCETGLNTELGKITKLVAATNEADTPLQKQLKKLSKTLSYFVIIITALIITIGVFQGRPIFAFGEAAREGMLSTAAALAVAAIPEGLLVSVTTILAIGMQAIFRKKSLVRKLIAAETLGSVSIICTDKTGTLTQGNMEVNKIVTFDRETSKHQYENIETLKDHDLIEKISLLCNNAVIENPNEPLENWKMIGDSTEKALLLSAIQTGMPYKKIRADQPKLTELSFNSERKFMVSLHQLDDKSNVMYAKGAPEKIISMASKVRINGKKEILTPAKTNELKKRYEKLTAEGLRLLAFAYRQVPKSKHIDDIEKELNDFIFVGFVALKDPLRPGIKETFALAKAAGIRPIIVTGDHQLTTRAILQELGIKIEAHNIIEGAELDKLSDEELSKKVKSIDIYARVEPRHKLRIIQAWQQKGEVVAMTGDGINDAPALKSADIGIALGSGTDVAKETSDMILLDNNFKTIIAAVEQGRVIYDNIRKVIVYLLADSFSEIILVGGSLLLYLPLPILPAQIIWINLIADGFPNLALTMEAGEKDIMSNPPRKKNEKILNSEMKALIFIIGIFSDLIMLALFYILCQSQIAELSHIRTIIFAAVGLDSLVYVFSCRSLRHSILTSNPFSNVYLVAAVLIGFALQITAIYQPGLANIFGNVPLGLYDWLLVTSLTLIKITGIELTKHHFIIKRKYA